MKWRRRHTVLTLVLTLFLILAGAFYVYFLYRGTILKDADGWHLELSYLPFRCQVCHGRVEALTYQGVPVRPPKWRWHREDGNIPRVHILTPVGAYTAWENNPYWRLWRNHLSVEDRDMFVMAEELAQGWYEARPTDETDFVPDFGPYIKKKDTPAHWCLLATYDAARWVDSARIDQLSW